MCARRAALRLRTSDEARPHVCVCALSPLPAARCLQCVCGCIHAGCVPRHRVLVGSGGAPCVMEGRKEGGEGASLARRAGRTGRREAAPHACLGLRSPRAALVGGSRRRQDDTARTSRFAA
eukprot:2775630-Prymnesium_polylepis.1